MDEKGKFLYQVPQVSSARNQVAEFEGVMVYF
jgi:hypothetical protein